MIIELMLEEKHNDLLEHIKKRKDNVIYVTELTECPQKREFRKRLWFLEVTKPSLIIGDLIHVGVQEFLKNIIGADRVETEVEIERRVDNYIIRGRIDVVIPGMVVEIKYARGIKGELPLIHHREQLQIYGWMMNVSEGILLYITPDGIKEYSEKITFNENNVYRLLVDKRKPRYDWECSYCPYSDYCPFNIHHQGGKRK